MHNRIRRTVDKMKQTTSSDKKDQTIDISSAETRLHILRDRNQAELDWPYEKGSPYTGYGCWMS